jgi:LytTr DNA-binding domain
MRIEGWDGIIGGPRWWARALSFAALVGALLALLGPYGSYYNALSLRLIDWIVILLLATVILGLAIPPLLRCGTWAGLPRPFVFVAALAVAAVPTAVIARTVSQFFWARHVAEYRWTDWYLQTFLLTLIVIALWATVEIARSMSRYEAAPAPTGSNAPPGDVICLQMEDHYVRVHCGTGSRLELMPLREAIRRYGGRQGLQVHRSWWVAGDAVAGVERDARNWRLRLRNGLVVPIARNRIREVRARGWLGGGADRC